jgi:chromosome segregation ATPase
VTNDAKEDWYLRLKGQTVMARPELALECSEKSGARLVMLPARSFLSHARKYLEVEVSDETILQAERAQTADDDRRIENAKQRVDALVRDEAEHTTRLDVAQNEQASLQAELDRARFQLDQARAQEESLSTRKATGAQISEAELSSASKRVSDLQVQIALAEDRVSAVQNEIELATRELQVKRAALNAAFTDYHDIKKEAGA